MLNVVYHLWSVVAGTFISNYDLGEIFLNFMSELELRPYAGDDFACIFPEDVSTLYPVIRE